MTHQLVTVIHDNRGTWLLFCSCAFYVTKNATNLNEYLIDASIEMMAHIKQQNALEELGR